MLGVASPTVGSWGEVDGGKRWDERVSVCGALWRVSFSSVVVGCGVLCSRELRCGAMCCVYSNNCVKTRGPKEASII